MTHAYIAEAVRTPRGKGNDKGSLKTIKPAELLAQTLLGLAERSGVDTAQIGDAVFGCVTQTGEQGASVGVMALPLAHWSDKVSGVTINRYCASGLSATHFASLQALHGGTVAVGGGVEMMSRVRMAKDEGPLTHDLELQRAAQLVPIGIGADTIATRCGFTRTMLDAMLEFRRRCEAIQHAVIVHQLCRPIWATWMRQAVLVGAIDAPGFTQRPRDYLAAKWIPQGWQWVDPEKEFKAMLLAIRSGLMSRSEAISTFGYDADDVDREIALDNARADRLGLVLDTDPRGDASFAASKTRSKRRQQTG